MLQIAVTAALKVGGGVGAKIFDQVAPKTALPYVVTGDDLVMNDGADGNEAAVSIRSTIRVFSDRTAGQRRQGKTIAGVIVERLDQAAIDLGPYWALVSLDHVSTQPLDDPDGSYQTVVTFNALLDPVEAS